LVPQSSVPSNNNSLPAVWAFKWKRLLDWSIGKWKAQLNVHSGR
jgi:hypothetical protein